jgi:hypothetical protein
MDRRAARYALIAALLIVMLACGGLADVTEINVRVTGVPQFVCPSSTPRPTATQRATAVQPDINYPSSGWVNTYREACTWHWNGYNYVESCTWVVDGGYYSTHAYSVPGPTSTPRPTHTPWPTPTPYVVYEEYSLGSDVHVGEQDALALRLRVDDIDIVPLSGDQQVVTWEVRVRNMGSVPYSTLPGAQTFVSEVGGVADSWYASSEAALAAGITLPPEALDIMVLNPGERLRLTMAAITPVGAVGEIGWILDPYAGGAGRGVVGGNTATWRNESDPEGCVGNVDEAFEIPTVGAESPTPTPSPTPWIPPYTGATRPPL